MRLILITLALSILISGKSFADEVRIVDVEAHRQQDGRYSFSVTLKHADNGWDHYADRWQVLDPQGEVLGDRVLMHPHVNEQPFTRGLSGVRIPAGLKVVSVRAHDKVHGNGPKLFEISLPGR
ncbi:MAG: hypothetical protein HOL66_01245 [Rhodospirillaceae bacterium]|jgi:hypothetical protein|nr:hypothetical protein [Rhodospirillaceae bacterium]MBT5242849.1 hypothetical protein [Rhodospirillaceae bacterium]MBT5561891.1 hypothetical protein [Rhodospirillaceae bacterium]MBT6241750.1 hypothetical protein [Rhodospirillaceae bacterium]MBT7136757.1 hypothetical protein [Rhodospirillaceae bacterium]